MKRYLLRPPSPSIPNFIVRSAWFNCAQLCWPPIAIFDAKPPGINYASIALNCADIIFNCAGPHLEIQGGGFQSSTHPLRILGWKWSRSIGFQLCLIAQQPFSIVLVFFLRFWLWLWYSFRTLSHSLAIWYNTVSLNNALYVGTIPSNNVSYVGAVTWNNVLYVGTVPSNNGHPIIISASFFIRMRAKTPLKVSITLIEEGEFARKNWYFFM